MNLNKAFVLGNLTREPEVRALPSGQQVTSFSIATNRYYTDGAGAKKEESEFHNIVCFGKLADISSRYLTKGAMVLIEGRLKTRNWQDQTGNKHYKTEIIAEGLQLGPRNGATPYKKFDRPEPEQPQNTRASADEIPIIEENYTPPSVEPQEGPKTAGAPFEDHAADEIDVKDIPF